MDVTVHGRASFDADLIKRLFLHNNIKGNKMKVYATVEREPGEKNFSCLLEIDSLKSSVLGVGNTAKQAIEDMQNGLNDLKECLKEEGKSMPELEIEYRFDIGALFSYYDFLNMAGVSRAVGITPSVIRQYVVGNRKPSEARKKQIETGLKVLAQQIQLARIY